MAETVRRCTSDRNVFVCGQQLNYTNILSSYLCTSSTYYQVYQVLMYNYEFEIKVGKKKKKFKKCFSKLKAILIVENNEMESNNNIQTEILKCNKLNNCGY